MGISAVALLRYFVIHEISSQESRYIVFSAIILTEDGTPRVDEALEIRSPAPSDSSGIGNHAEYRSLEDVERAHIAAVLEQTEWCIAGDNGAAVILNLHPNTLRSRMKKLGIKKS